MREGGSGHRPLTGEKLGMRDSGPVKRVCYFGQISPPKDVSIAYLVGGDGRITPNKSTVLNRIARSSY
jgi:hypothetical protein